MLFELVSPPAAPSVPVLTTSNIPSGAGRHRRQQETDETTSNCLDLLRRQTRTAHDATEAQFAAFLSAPASHLDSFLLTHLLAFEALSKARIGPELPEENGCLPDMISRLRADCDIRGLAVAKAPIMLPLPSAAVAYLVIGSRLGTEVIRRKLIGVIPEADLPQYFAPQGANHDTALAWQALRDRLGGIPADSVEATEICAGALRGFDAFAEADVIMRTTCGTGRMLPPSHIPATQEF
jgi:heme oxygenase